MVQGIQSIWTNSFQHVSYKCKGRQKRVTRLICSLYVRQGISAHSLFLSTFLNMNVLHPICRHLSPEARTKSQLKCIYCFFSLNHVNTEHAETVVFHVCVFLYCACGLWLCLYLIMKKKEIKKHHKYLFWLRFFRYFLPTTLFVSHNVCKFCCFSHC